MPQLPDSSAVHVNTPLTNMSVAFMQNAANFVADQAFPVVPVTKESDRYFTYDRGSFNRDEMALRAPGAMSDGATYSIDNTPTYFCNVWALHRWIPDQLRANADSPIQLDREANEFLTHKALIRKERLWASKYFATSLWTTDITGVASAPGASQVLQWNDAASTPIENVRTGKRVVLTSTGFMPNLLVLARETYDALVDHPDIVGRIDRGQTTGPAIATRDALAALFEVDRVLVMDGIYNSAKEGQTATHALIGSKKALLCYAAPNAGLMTPSAGYTFAWTGYTGASALGTRVSQFRNDERRADKIEIEMAIDQKLIAADLGYFFTSIVA